MIRPYSGDDKTKLVQLLQLNTPKYFHESEEQDFIEYLDQHVQHYFVVEQAGVILASGGINYVENGRIARISWDLVHPNYQGQGIGRELTQYRIDLIKENSAVEKIVVRTTQLVYKFYQKLGFELVETRKDFWAKGFDLYQMELPVKRS